MPTYEVTSPDGRKFDITAPDGATQDQVLTYAKSQFASMPAKAAASVIPQEDPGVAGATLIGAGRATERGVSGFEQLNQKLSGSIARMLPFDAAQAFADRQDQRLASEKQREADDTAEYKKLHALHPLATTVGETLPAMALLPAASTVGGAAAVSSLPGLISYGSPTERLIEGGLGAAGRTVGSLAGKLLGRVAQPIREAADNGAASLAQRLGIPLDAAQATNSKPLRSLVGALREMPGSAGVMAEAEQAQKAAFNSKALGLMGETGDAVGQDGAKLAQRAIGGRLEDAAKGVTLDLTHNVVQNELAGIEQHYMRNLTADQKPLVKNAIDDILQAGTIDGATYQMWRSRLGAIAQGTRDSEYKGAIKGIQSVLDRAFDRAAPADQAAAMTAARAQYQNFKTLDPLLQKAELSTGNISPANVMNRVVVKGNQQPEMRDLATVGQAMRDYPNSGTAMRELWQHPLSALLSAVPSYAAAKAITSDAGKNYLTKGLLDITPEIEKRLMQMGAGGGLLGLNALLPNR